MTLFERLKQAVMPEKKESKIDKEFRKKLYELPFPVYARKNHGGIDSINEPDWTLCVLGCYLCIETKRDEKASSTKASRREGQRIVSELIKRAGGRYVKCYDSDDMIEAVYEVYHQQKRLISLDEDNEY